MRSSILYSHLYRWCRNNQLLKTSICIISVIGARYYDTIVRSLKSIIGTISDTQAPLISRRSLKNRNEQETTCKLTQSYRPISVGPRILFCVLCLVFCICRRSAKPNLDRRPNAPPVTTPSFTTTTNTTIGETWPPRTRQELEK